MCMCKDSECRKSKLSKFALGIALGLTKGLWLMLSAWVAWLSGHSMAMVQHIAQFYPGYGASLKGGLVGGAYGLICGFIIGVIFAFFYNWALCCCRGKCEKCDSKESKV